MDLKGISWVGNIYQKFEAMCLEVEEIMYQDTIKYVENQVQTVGSSVKKFYSDVMQDMASPCSMDLAKGVGTDVPLELYADVGIFMKPKVGLKEKDGKFGDRDSLTEDPKIIADKKPENLLTFHRLSTVENMLPLSQGESVGGASRHLGKRGLSNKSNPGTKKNSNRENMPLNKKLGATSRINKDLTRASSCKISSENVGVSAGVARKHYGKNNLSKDSALETNENSGQNMFQNGKSRVITYVDLTRASSDNEISNGNHKECVDQKVKTTAPETIEMAGDDSIDESKNEIKNANEQIPDIQMDGALPDRVNSIESGTSKGMDMTSSSGDSSSAEANAPDDYRSDRVDFSVEGSENGDKEDFVSNSVRLDDCSTDVDKADFSVDHEMEIIQQADKEKLEESCILVNGNECHFVLQNEGKSKSYKKKIRDVFSPRKSSARKHEYEQLSLWPGSDLNPKQEERAKPSLTKKDAKRSSTPDSCESEWELL